jgi:hypothetical protein
MTCCRSPGERFLPGPSAPIGLGSKSRCGCGMFHISNFLSFFSFRAAVLMSISFLETATTTKPSCPIICELSTSTMPSQNAFGRQSSLRRFWRCSMRCAFFSSCRSFLFDVIPWLSYSNGNYSCILSTLGLVVNSLIRSFICEFC